MKAKRTLKDRAAGVINVSLTVDERDAIDAAKGRIRRLVPLAISRADLVTPQDDDGGVPDLLEIIGEEIDKIDATFAAADVRLGK